MAYPIKHPLYSNIESFQKPAPRTLDDPYPYP